MIEKYIKTKCGLDKYYHLKSREGLLVRIRLYWFLIFGTLRDIGKRSASGTNSFQRKTPWGKKHVGAGRFSKFKNILKGYLALSKYKGL